MSARGSSIIRVTLLAEARRFAQEFKDAEGATTSLGQRFQALAQAAALYLAFRATRAVKDFVSDSKRAYVDLNESTNAFEQTLGDAADAVDEFGRTSAQSFGLSRAEFNQTAVSFAGFVRQIQGEGRSFEDVMEALITRASDFASVQNLEVNEAVSIFQSTLAGQTRPIRQYGLDLSAAAVQAHALAEGIWDGEGAMTEQEKVLGRYSLLMKETDRWAGDFARTSGEVANATRIANAELEDAKALLGQALAPLWKAMPPLLREAARHVSGLATELAILTGELDRAEVHHERFQQSLRDGKDPVDAMREAISGRGEFSLHGSLLLLSEFFEGGFFESLFGEWARWTEDVDQKTEDLAETIQGLNRHQLQDLIDALPELQTELGLSDEAVDAIEQTLRNKLRRELIETRRGFRSTIDEGIDPFTQALGEGEEASKSFAEQQDALINPLGRLRQATENVEEKQRAYNEAVSKFGDDSPEAIQAGWDLMEAIAGQDLAVEKAEAAVEKYGDRWGDLVGKTPLWKRTMEAMMEDLNRRGLRITLRAPSLWYDIPSHMVPGGRTHIVPRHGGFHAFQEGGVARARPGRGVPGVFAEGFDDEMVTPLNKQGLNFLVNAMRQLGFGGGGNTYHITVQAGVGDPQAIGRAVVEALQTYERANGAIPIQVRSP